MSNAVKTIVAVKNLKGTKFVGVQNYTNSKGETSNQTFLVGINYANLLKNDLKKLQSKEVVSMVANLTKKYDKETVIKAYTELENSLIKRTADEKEKEILRANNDLTIKLSDAQKDAYTQVAKGLKAKDNNLFIYGLLVRKKVLIEGVYPTKKQRVKTIIKDEIKKFAELRELKYRNFKLGSLESLSISGINIEQI